MRHLLYWGLLAIALVFAAILALPFAMSECQLLPDQRAVDGCFAANRLAWRAYGVSLVVLLGLSVASYIRRGRRAIASLFLVAFGPVVIAMVLR